MNRKTTPLGRLPIHQVLPSNTIAPSVAMTSQPEVPSGDQVHLFNATFNSVGGDQYIINRSHGRPLGIMCLIGPAD